MENPGLEGYEDKQACGFQNLMLPLDLENV